MRYTRLGLPLCLLLTCAHLAPATAQPTRTWEVPANAVTATALPKLTQPLVLDGDLREWGSALCAPMHSRCHVLLVKRPHKWRGPSDAGADFYCAWSAEGLCLAANVTDDQIYNSYPVPLTYEQDCVEFYADGRPQESRGAFYGWGTMQIAIRPPIAQEGAVIATKYFGTEGMKCAGKKTATGCTVEVLVPWSLLSGFKPKPGARIALGLGLVDSDARDGKLKRPLYMNWWATNGTWLVPNRLIPFELTDVEETGRATIDMFASIKPPAITTRDTASLISVEVCEPLSARAALARVSVVDPNGKNVLSERSTFVDSPGGRSTRIATARCNLDELADGCCVVSAEIFGKDGSSLGTVKRPLPKVSALFERSIGCIGRAQISTLAAQHPFKAAQYAGLAACAEKLKRSAELIGPFACASAATEMEATLELMEKGEVTATESGLYDLLNLTKNADSQVVAEFDGPQEASVMFNWGGIPLAVASVHQYPDEAQARKSLEPQDEIPGSSEAVTVEGMPGRVGIRDYIYKYAGPAQVSPERHCTLVQTKTKEGITFDLDQLSEPPSPLLVVIPGCPKQTLAKVESWAKQNQMRTVDLKEAMTRDEFLVVGDLTSEAAAELKGFSFRVPVAVDRFTSLTVVSGKRVIRVDAPSRQIAEQVVRLVAAGKPVEVENVDSIRVGLVDLLGRQAQSALMPKGMSIYSGDLHTHTFYSDGVASPVESVLEAIYSQMDFLAITDHNTLGGALFARELLPQHGVSYPLIVGEEITTEPIHLNAYPLKRVVNPSDSLEQMIKDAHEQGAVIQWNHPWARNDWGREHLRTGIKDTGIDAWEGIPDYYEEWKKDGTLPAMTGGSDSHDGRFAGLVRTIVVAPSPDGKDVADCVRSGRVLCLSTRSSDFLCCSESVRSAVCSALADGRSLKEAKARRLSEVLRSADIKALLNAAHPDLQPEMPRGE